MNQAIVGIIDRLMGEVKTDKPFYSLKNLISYGFPPMVVEVIRVNLRNKITDELTLPQTKWTNLNNKLVDEAWQDFKETVVSNSGIPKNELYGVTESAVNEVVQVCLEPRKCMAEYIFQGKEEMDLDEIQLRCDELSFYKQFGRAIPLYMKKRNIDRLSKSRCKLLVQNLDANLMASYSAEDWAQVLKPLFVLFDGKIPSRFLQLFFEDKGLYLSAKTFKALNGEVSREQFKNILSGSDLLDVKHQEENKEQYLQELKEAGKSKSANGSAVAKEQNLLNEFIGDYEDEEPLTEEESFNALFKAEQESVALYEEHEKESAEKKSIKAEHNSSDSSQLHENLTSVLDLAADSYNSLSKEEAKKKEEKSPAQEEPEKVKSPTENKAETPTDTEQKDLTGEDSPLEDDDKPMWQQFISPDQMDLIMGSKKEEDTEDEESGIFVEKDGFVDEPVVDIIPEDEEEEIPDLRVYLLGQEVFYIEELFGGSEEAYERVLDRVQVHDNWKSASEYLHNDVFSSDKIDMFSDAAVDFTDKLQSYFNEYKN